MAYASEELRGDREVVLEAVSQNYYALQYASREVVLEAVRQNGRALLYANAELQGDRNFILKLKYASPELRRLARARMLKKYNP